MHKERDKRDEKFNSSPSEINKDKDINQCFLSREVKYSYLSYAISTNESRSIPDSRDGLKPCARRIIYSMYEKGYLPNKHFSKSASTVGDVLGSYHPHGEQAIYETLVRMTQPFNIRYPLMTGQGNFGSLDGDSAAASRYTSIRLSPYSNLFIDDLDFDTVPVSPNYDDSKNEPQILPVSVPALILNGSIGIAVGMCTGIPPHNFHEVLNAFIAYIKNPDLTLRELMEFIKGPDFPHGGEVINKDDLEEIYRTGMGQIKVRGTYTLEENAIIINAIPYKVNKASLLQEIMDVIKNQNIKGVEKIWDESDNKKIRIVIKINQLCSVDFLIRILYKHTQLQSTFSCNFIALDNKKPSIMGLLDLMQSFTQGRMEVIRRRYSYLLKKTRKQQEHTFAILVVLDNLEEIIQIIKHSPDRKGAIQKLLEKTWKCEKIVDYVNKEFLQYVDLRNYTFSQEQCEYILGIRMQQLTQMEYKEVVQQMLKNYENINYYLSVVDSESEIKKKIIEETEQILQKKWIGSERRTKISQLDDDDVICAPDEQVMVIIDSNDYVKRMPLTTYKTQHRGGVGKNVVENDLKMAMVTNTKEKILCVTSREDGLCMAYPLQVYQINEFIGNKAKGQHINTLINDDHKHVIKAMFNPSDKQYKYLLFVTSNGTIRKNSIESFQSVRKNGKQVMKIGENSSIIDVLSVKEDDLIVIASKKGRLITFLENDVRCFNSNYSQGVRGMSLKLGDKVIKADVVKPNKSLLTVTALGFGKITALNEYRITKRGGTGVKLCNLQKNDEVMGAYLCDGQEDLIIGTKAGNIFKTNCKEIRKMHKNTKGVQLCRIKESDDKVVFASLLIKYNEEEDNKDNKKEELHGSAE